MSIQVAIVEDERKARENWVKILNAHPKLTCVAACATGEETLKLLPDARTFQGERSRVAPPFHNSHAMNSETYLHSGDDIAYAG